MKKTMLKKIISLLIAALMISPFAFALSSAADSDQFRIDLTVPASASPGDKINIICSVNGIVPAEGLIGVSLTLTFDPAALSPDVVSASVEDTDVYQVFMTKAPTYILKAGEVETEVPAYENICRCYADQGKYSLMFFDMLSYPGKKAGTTVNTILKNDGDLTLTIPFTVKEGLPNGHTVKVGVSDITGTVALDQPKSVSAPNYDTGFVIVSDIPATTASSGGTSDTTVESASITSSATGAATDPAKETTSDDPSAASTETLTSERDSASETKKDTASAETKEDQTGTGSGTKQDPSSQENNNTAIIVNVISLVVVLIATGVILLIMKKKNKKTTGSDNNRSL